MEDDMLGATEAEKLYATLTEACTSEQSLYDELRAAAATLASKMSAIRNNRDRFIAENKEQYAAFVAQNTPQ